MVTTIANEECEDLNLKKRLCGIQTDTDRQTDQQAGGPTSLSLLPSLNSDVGSSVPLSPSVKTTITRWHSDELPSNRRAFSTAGLNSALPSSWESINTSSFTA